jgi:hypothetical protein
MTTVSELLTLLATRRGLEFGVLHNDLPANDWCEHCYAFRTGLGQALRCGFGALAGTLIAIVL